MKNKKNRKKNKNINFRLSPVEKSKLEARIKFSGMKKQDYILDNLLKKETLIYYGKFESDRLSVEIKKLYEIIDSKIKLDEKQIYYEDLIEIKELCLKLLDSRKD